MIFPLTFYTLISHLLIHTFYSVKDLGSQVSVVLSHKTFMNWHLHHNTINLLPQSSFIIIRTYMRAWWYTTPLTSQLIRQQVGLQWNGISLLSLIFQIYLYFNCCQRKLNFSKIVIFQKLYINLIKIISKIILQ